MARTAPRFLKGTRKKPGRVGGNYITVSPAAEELLAPQIRDYMDEVGEFAAKYARGIVPRDAGIMEKTIDYDVEAKTGMVTIFSASPNAHMMEWGTGMRGKATKNSRGAGKWPNDRDPDYGTFYRSRKPGTRRGQAFLGAAAQPFIRPAAVAAVRRFFSSKGL